MIDKKNTTTPKKKLNYFRGKNDNIVTRKLAKAFKLGMTDEEACYFVDISIYELRRYERENPQLAKKKAKLQKGYQLAVQDENEWIRKFIEGENQGMREYEFAHCSREALLKRYAKKIEDFGVEKTKQDEQNTLDEIEQIEGEVMEAMSLDTKELMLKAIPCGTGKKSFALELAQSLEKDFEVKTATEKSLVQMAVLAFISYLHVSYEVQQNSYLRDYSDEQRASTGYLMAVTKEKNNALRQYTSVIQTLKSLKASPIKVNIVAQTLNMGQNQQINNPST